MFKSIFKGLFGKSDKAVEAIEIVEEIVEPYQRVPIRYVPEYHHIKKIIDIESERAKIIRELNYEGDNNTYDEHIWYMR